MELFANNWVFLLYLALLVLGNFLLKRHCGVGFFESLPLYESKLKRFFATTFQIWLVLIAFIVTVVCIFVSDYIL